MPLTIDDCTGLSGHCVIAYFPVTPCLGEETPANPPQIIGNIRRKNLGTEKICDPNGAILFQDLMQQFETADAETITINGCDYWALKSCVLPATSDSEYDPEDPASPVRALFGTSYCLTVTIGGKQCIWDFGIDAAVDYTQYEVEGCIPIKTIAGSTGTPPIPTQSLEEIVCNLPCIQELINKPVCDPECWPDLATNLLVTT